MIKVKGSNFYVLQERGNRRVYGKNPLKKNGLFRKNDGEMKIIETRIYLLRLLKLENLYIYIVITGTILFRATEFQSRVYF